jgi:hypothetical protein
MLHEVKITSLNLLSPFFCVDMSKNKNNNPQSSHVHWRIREENQTTQ